MRMSGKCLCGNVRTTCEGDPMKSLTCYCNACRKLSGNLGLIGSLWSTDNVTIEDPNNKLKKFICEGTDSGVGNSAVFCGDCSMLLYRKSERGSNYMAVAHVTFDEGWEQLPPTEAIHTEARCSWYKVLADL